MTKEIRYDRATKDFEVIIDGRTIGYRATYLAAEAAANEYAYECLSRGGHDAADLAAEDVQDVATALATVGTPTPPAPQPIAIDDLAVATQVAIALNFDRWQRAMLVGDWTEAAQLDQRRADLSAQWLRVLKQAAAVESMKRRAA